MFNQTFFPKPLLAGLRMNPGRLYVAQAILCQMLAGKPSGGNNPVRMDKGSGKGGYC